MVSFCEQVISAKDALERERESTWSADPLRRGRLGRRQDNVNGVMTEARKILAKGNVQGPTNSVKASGDAGGKSQARHKNKDKIPKSLRYDLEKALVGLCDVWFGEIKPYLVRNNVKVHVHDEEEGPGDREAPAPECSHVDPGRSHQRQRPSVDCVDSYSTRQTALRARYPKPLSQPVSSLKPDRAMENPCPNCKNDLKKSRREKRQAVSQSPPRPLVPRLCRTYSIPPKNTLVQPVINNSNIEVHLQKPRNNNKVGYPLPKPKIMKDASILTEKRSKERVKREQGKPQSKEVQKGKSQSSSVKKNPIKDDVVKTERKKINPRSLSPQFGRCQATTTFFSRKIKTEKPEPALFQDELINIISEKHKKLKILYTSSVQEEYPSILNLYSPTCNLLTSKQTYKTPWR